MSKSVAQNRLALRVLTRLSRAHARVTGEIETALKSAGLPVLAQHDLLAVLSDAPEKRSRPAEIGLWLLMAQYNLSRLIDRLDASGLVRREVVAGDARGQWVVLTLNGAVIHQQMAEIVSNTAAAHLNAALEEDQLRRLSKLLRKLSPEPEKAELAAP